MVLDGYKTYIAGILAFAGAAYVTFYGNDPARAYELFIIGLGFIGIKSSIPKTA